MEKGDEIVMPGFRFHPTDEELVGFYLKRKIQQKPLDIELIRQLDIYKYDPWDLPKLAATEEKEKEWYFYCRRERKYKNSARPNRVTGAGFWKATGTDRPIYDSEGTHRCIGLKKSLVFYCGRAAKGVKTDWMMHEFRLPSLADAPPSTSRLLSEKQEAWVICKIFKKNDSMAQRALSYPLGEGLFSISKMAPSPAESGSAIQFAFGNQQQQQQENSMSCNLDFESISYKHSNLIDDCSYSPLFLFSPEEIQTPSSMSLVTGESSCNPDGIECGGELKGLNFPFSLPPNVDSEWKAPNLAWEYSSPPSYSYSSEISANNLPSNKCFT